MCSILTSGERGVVRRRGEGKFHSNQLLRSWNRGNGGEGRSVRNFFPGGMTAGITPPPWHAALESGKKKVERNFRSSPRSHTRLQSWYSTSHAWTCAKAFLWSHWKSKDPPLCVERPFDLSLSSFNKFEKGSFFSGKSFALSFPWSYGVLTYQTFS